MPISVEFNTQEEAHTWALEFIKQSKRDLPTNIFREVQFRSDELVAINEKYPLAVEQGEVAKHANNKANFPYVEHLTFNETGTSAITIGEYDIHDLLRKLSLAVYGVRKNNDMQVKDFEHATQFYQKVKELFLEEYTNRMERLEETK